MNQVQQASKQERRTISYVCKRQRVSSRDASSTRSGDRPRRLDRSGFTRIEPYSVTPTQRLPSPNIPPPDTLPNAIDCLWKEIRSATRTRRMPQQPRYARPTATSQSRQLKRDALPTPSNSSAPSVITNESSVQHDGSARQRKHRVTDSDFRTSILSRYGIMICDDPDLRTPFEHFGTKKPEVNFAHADCARRITEWYGNEHGKQDSDVWLRMDVSEAESVARQYVALRLLHENEAKFSYRGKNYFFKEDDIVSVNDEERLNNAYFKLEWGPKPDERRLRSPPLVAGSEDTDSRFSFATNPDCTYWLRLCRMSHHYRSAVRNLTFTLPHAQAVAPYFTIEFKKDNQEVDVAENQLAAAAALILYNRVRLRCDRLHKCSRARSSWQTGDFDDLKHYGITFSGSEARLFVITPTLDFDTRVSTEETGEGAFDVWRGCQVTGFKDVDVSRTSDVLELQQWINEIHNWGLGIHSNTVVLDVKGIMIQQPGGADRVSMTPEDAQAWGITPE